MASVLSRMLTPPRRALPHAAIYSAHMRACESGTPSPFAIQAIEPSMRSILDLADAVYEPVAAR